jgi:type II secretory pathway predicted ATPase ExeA
MTINAGSPVRLRHGKWIFRVVTLMYESFYGLKTKPFSMLPDPDFLYMGKNHRIALTLLEYALMNNAGFCVITDEIGAGKTTLLRRLLATIEDHFTVGMITNTHQSFGELLDWILSAYGIHQPGLGKVEMHQRLVDFMLEQYAKNKTTLLIVDEAQNMPVATLEELRMLSNINSEKDLVLQVILSGQPDLKDTLRRPELKQFAQRISVDYHLDALTSAETSSYIQHRLVTAGASDDIFTPQACRLIHEYSGGVPRLINLLCDTALVYGFADQKKTVDVDLVEEMVNERMQGSILPLASVDKSKKIVKGDDGDFPWINPDGGTKGLKPVAEKKTAENNAAEIKQTKAPSSESQTAVRAVQQVTTSDKAVIDAEQSGLSTNKTTTAETFTSPDSRQADANRKEDAGQDTIAVDTYASRHEHKASTDIDSVSEPVQEEPGNASISNWFMLVAMVVVALFLSVAIILFYQQPEMSDDVRGRLVEAENMKQEMARMRQQAEVMQREREAALEKARLEQQQRSQAEQAAVEAANQEKAARAAAELAAEEALQATRKAEELTEKQRLEEQKLLDERKRIEKEKRQAELEWQRLMLERKQAKQERLEIERTKAEELEQ